MHCNLRPPELHQSFSCFNYDAMPSLKSLNLSTAFYSVFWCWYITLRCDLDLWPLTLNIYSVSPETWWNSVSNLNAIEQFATELLRYQCLTLWPWTSLIFDNLSVLELWRFYADTLCHAVTLTLDPLTLKVHGTSSITRSKYVRNLSKIVLSRLILEENGRFAFSSAPPLLGGLRATYDDHLRISGKRI